MLGEGHVDLAAEAVSGLVQIFRPGVGVTHLRAADRIDVVQIVGGVLGQVQRPECRVEHVHLGRRLGLRRELEDDLDAVDPVCLDGLPDEAGRRDEGDGATRETLAETRVDLGARAPRQGRAELELSAPDHRRAG